MSEEWQRSLFEVLGGWVFVLTIGFAGAVYMIGQRLSRMEAFIEMAGSKAFKSLHRDDDKFRLDGLIQKYLDNNDDLPMEDWMAVKESCEKLLEDKMLSADVKTALGLTAAFANHKLMRWGMSKTHTKKLI